ncbi:MAG: potassium channel family protein [Muribaculaceae bacterium]|nr:potassium channel family protein [Muribaculaceae bacterium]
MTTSAATSPTPSLQGKTQRNYVKTIMNMVVLLLSATLIVWISIDTFNNVEILTNVRYMHFQFWVCLVFIIDFFVGLWYAEKKRRYFWQHLLFLIISIPYLNLIDYFGLQLGPEANYYIRFIPLMRGALAFAIVVSYVSSNAVTSLFSSYITIMLFIVYFASLIFYQMENPVNPQINTYWTALWWAAMNMSTVGCYINPVTVTGKVVAVILPITGMIIFPLFTVYLTNYVTNALKKNEASDKQN